ncbi:MAG: integrase core domain-containing protein [Candidatus Paceibacterota bacterium]|nr:integrase core domain-containing protein [Clostridia bacterium]MDD3971331.1 integrase core domain-containing protein [Clostridia bacterium]
MLLKKFIDSEEKLRQDAVNLFLNKESISKIASSLSRSRQWVYKWISRYENNPSLDWYMNESTAPKVQLKRLPLDVEQSIVEARKRLSSNPYSQNGAISILYELKRLGITTPSVATINRVLKKKDLIGRKKTSTGTFKEYPTHYHDVQQMDLIGPRYLKGGFKFYIFTIIDKNNHLAGVYPITNKSANVIVPCLVDFWILYQMPDYLQMDNELSFRGSNRHPRGLGLLLRTAISNGVTPLFIPPAEPWRNGVVEKFNESVQNHFLSTPFSFLEEMQVKATEFSVFHNTEHRYSSQNNKSPNEMLEEMKYLAKLKRETDLSKRPVIEEGQLIFVRFIRSDLKLHLLNSIFEVSEKLVYSYVEAIVQIDKHLLIVKHKEMIYHYFEFVMPLS